MAIPSFDELLEKAKQVSEREQSRQATERTSGLAAKGLSDLVNTLLFTPQGERETYAGTISQEGKFTPFQTPQRTGLTLAERIFGGKEYQPKELVSGAIPLTSKEVREFGTKSILERQKQLSYTQRQEQKLRAQKELLQMKIDVNKLARNQPLGSEVSREVYQFVYGTDPANPVSYTKGQADVLLRTKLGDETQFWRELGVEIKLGKDITGQIPPEKKAEISGKMEKRKGKLFSYPAYSNEESVRAAFSRGEIKVGDTVVINGVETIIK